jgi:hypothetical protein
MYIAFVKYVAVFIILCLTLSCYAQNSEEITFTTYYPSPYGSYRELDANYINIINTPNDPGMINFLPGSAPAAGVGSEGSLYYDSTLHKFMYKNNTGSWGPLGGGAYIIGATDGYAGNTGNQACAAVGRTCNRVVSYNYIWEDAACSSAATHCMRVCMVWYNQSLPGVVNGGDEDNIHSCDALLGNYTTYLDPGIVRCNAFFSAVCN